jgi:hypothetical protein
MGSLPVATEATVSCRYHDGPVRTIMRTQPALRQRSSRQGWGCLASSQVVSMRGAAWMLTISRASGPTARNACGVRSGATTTSAAAASTGCGPRIALPATPSTARKPTPPPRCGRRGWIDPGVRNHRAGRQCGRRRGRRRLLPTDATSVMGVVQTGGDQRDFDGRRLLWYRLPAPAESDRGQGTESRGVPQSRDRSSACVARGSWRRSVESHG